MRPRLILIPLLLIAAALLIWLPIEVPYSVSTSGRILPLQEWLVVRGDADHLISILKDNRQGQTSTYAVTYVERGDNLTYNAHRDIRLGASIAAGDTVAQLHSYEVDRDLTRLRAELANAEATFNSFQAGSKEPVIREVVNRIAYAETRVDQQLKRAERFRALFAKKLVPEEELDLEENALRLAKMDVEIVKAQLQVVQTGSSVAELDLMRSRIAGLQSEIDINERRRDYATLVSPLDGQVASFFTGDSLVVVHDTSDLVLILPVLWKEMEYVKQGQKLELSVDGRREMLRARIESVGTTVQSINGEQVVAVSAHVMDRDPKLVPGLVVRCTIPCQPIGPLEYLRRKL